MNIEQKITFVFNRLLIDFFKEIKKDNYFKCAIKKHYKVIDKKSPTYIKSFVKKVKNNEFEKLFLDKDFDVNNLDIYGELQNVTILKNISISKLVRTFNDNKQNIMSYLFMLYIFSHLYNSFKEQIQEYRENNTGKDTEKCIDDDEDDDNKVDEELLDDEEDDDDDDDDEDKQDDKENSDEDEVTLDDIYKDQQSYLVLIIGLIEKINNKEDITNELSEILDDEIKILLVNLKKVKVVVNMNTNIDDLIGDSKIGNLAKEISNSINLEDLNIENPSDLLNPENLFGGNGGNLIGNLVQQVGSSITDKINSGEIRQDELVKDAFSLMSRMQGGSDNNPIINDMMSNMMNARDNGESGGNAGGNAGGNVGGNVGGAGATNQPAMPDFADMMKNMMNPDMMQQMMNSMGGTQGLNQNNPNSREGQMRQKLQEKLQKKE
jgi:hypothetical protein